MKTLLQINTIVNSGSTGKITEEIGKLALSTGWKSFIAYGRNPRHSESSLLRVGSNLDIALHGLHTRLFDRHGFGSFKATKDFVNIVETINPDIIHLHNIHGYYINVEILFEFLAKIGIPVIWTLHDCWSFTGHCSHYSIVNCQKWQVQCFSCPQLSKYPSSLFIDNSIKNYIDKKKIFTGIDNLTLVPVSAWLEGEVHKSFFKKNPVRMINNGIDLEVFKIKELKDIQNIFNFPDKKIILGVANVWTKEKGFNDFMELNKLLASEFHIVLVGLNKSQISRLPLGITGIERTENQEDLATLYNLAHIYLNLTWEDTFPTTNLEALACGTPVITYDIGGSPESVTKETGFVVKKWDYISIISALKVIEENGIESYRMACRDRALNNYDKYDRFNEYMDLYKSLLNE